MTTDKASLLNSLAETPEKAVERLTGYLAKQGYSLAAIHTYTDAKGKPLFWKSRHELIEPSPDKKRKEFRFISIKDEQYQQKAPEGIKPLYNLRLLTKYTERDVWIVEGELCVDCLTSLKILSVTTGGASSIGGYDFEVLRGRKVILWRDDDDAGMAWLTAMQDRLLALNCKISVIDVEKLGLPVKGDVRDWVANFKAFNDREPTRVDVEALPLIVEQIKPPSSDNLTRGDANVLPQTDDELIAYLATLKPIEYDRIRKDQAKALGVQVKTLDSMVKAEREAIQQDDSPFNDIDPWHEPINPTQLLDEITQTIQRFIVLDEHQAQTAALWVAACWFVDVIQCAPIALINAPERACGKTQLLSVLAKLAPRTAQASGISPSVLFRMVEAYQPTLFIDEIETILKDNEELRGLINAGHTRDSAYVWRSVAKGDDFEPKRFKVWGMKAIAGINAIKLAETVTSRSIVFELRRKRADEKVERIRQAEVGLFEMHSRQLARFSEDYASQVKDARPILPDALGDRDQDNWEPLLQVAAVAGGHWFDKATNAALKLAGAIQAPMSSANELLTDIQEIFEARKTVRISTSDLISALCEDAEKSWATYNRGKPLSPRQLSIKLKDYGIASKDLRFGYDGVKKGYEAEQFNDAFSRYLTDPLNYPLQRNNSLKANNDKDCDVAYEESISATRNISATQKPTPIVACSVVADKNSFLGVSAEINFQNNSMEF